MGCLGNFPDRTFATTQPKDTDLATQPKDTDLAENKWAVWVTFLTEPLLLVHARQSPRLPRLGTILNLPRHGLWLAQRLAHRAFPPSRPATARAILPSHCLTKPEWSATKSIAIREFDKSRWPISMSTKSQNIHQRVNEACDVLLKRTGTVGPLELLVQLGFLAGVHLSEWQKGNSYYNPLQPHIQCGVKKLRLTYRFSEWVTVKKLAPMEASYLRASRQGTQPLKIATDGDPETEQFFRTHFRRGDLSPARKKQLEKKLNKVPDLVVFQITSSESQCSECGDELTRRDFFFKEGERGLCLTCADMDHLEFLASGNVAMTRRRSKKFSPLSAVVVRFNARRKRYERQGILVTPKAIDEAEEQCHADADQRAARRQIAAVHRTENDEKLIATMTRRSLDQFSQLPANRSPANCRPCRTPR